MGEPRKENEQLSTSDQARTLAEQVARLIPEHNPSVQVRDKMDLNPGDFGIPPSIAVRRLPPRTKANKEKTRRTVSLQRHFDEAGQPPTTGHLATIRIEQGDTSANRTTLAYEVHREKALAGTDLEYQLECIVTTPEQTRARNRIARAALAGAEDPSTAEAADVAAVRANVHDARATAQALGELRTYSDEADGLINILDCVINPPHLS